MTTSVRYTNDSRHAHRTMGIGAVIALIGWSLSWFDFANMVAAALFTVGLVILIYGKVRYIIVMRKKPDQDIVDDPVSTIDKGRER